MASHVILLFTRLPIPGQCKTRLLPVCTEAECADLQRAMAADAMTALSRLPQDVLLFYTGDGPVELLGPIPEGIRVFPQQGRDLGARMDCAIRYAFQMGYESVLLMGSDLPFLDEDDVALTGTLLEQHDVVFGPSDDGGYWLVGMKQPFSDLFVHQPYGTGQVLASALEICHRHGRSVGFAPLRRDLDTPEDLHWFQSLLECDVVPTCHTATLMNTILRSQLSTD